MAERLSPSLETKKIKLYEAPKDGREDVFEFIPVDMEDVPSKIAMFLEERKQQEERSMHSPRKEWEKVYRVTGEKVRSYIASVLLMEGHVRLTFFADVVGADDTIAGEGRVFKKIEGEISNENGASETAPGYTANMPLFRGVGLGERRLALMNAYSRMMYNSNLFSSYIINEMGRAVWKDLLHRGRATKTEYVDAKGDARFMFLK